MTNGDILVAMAVLFLAFKPEITQQLQRLKKRIQRKLNK